LVAPKLTITFLGTGTSSGVPMIGCDCAVCTSTDTRDNRLRSSIWVRSEQTSLVVDAGPDFRAQMLRSNINTLDAILLTHAHKDHMAGLDDVRAYNHFQRRPMHLYADPRTEEAVRRDFYYAFSDGKYPGTPDIDLFSIGSEPFQVGDIPVTPIEVMHLRMPVLGFRFGDFTYITDANFIEEAELDKIRGSRVLVLNALRKEKHLSHFTLSEAIELATSLDVPQVYFTHISHQLGSHAEVSAELPAGCNLAYDGLTVQIL
jgi:phosphoribosyl 1,2-cyclic phosphate phosphodiesterase